MMENGSTISAYDGDPAGRTFRVIEKDHVQPPRRLRDPAVPAIPIGLQAHYATVLVTLYPGGWVVDHHSGTASPPPVLREP